MANTYTGLAAGSLKIQKYNNFRGVDFTDNNVNESRSPNALNMWKDYKRLGKRIETRPGIENIIEEDNTIFGLFFYKVSNKDHIIYHVGTRLIDYNVETDTKTTIKALGMNPARSTFFIYNNILFIKDGINYLEYNGVTLSNVVGTIPLTSIARKPAGGGTQYQDVNLLSNYRKNTFWADGTSTDYYLDATAINAVSLVKVNGVTMTETTDYIVDLTNGKVSFTTSPSAAYDDDNVEITYRKDISGNSNKILKCNLSCNFDNRIFFSGNQDYPNAIFWCAYNDPRYVGDLNYSLEGTDTALVKALVPGNNALWVFKEPSQANTTVFYHVPLEQYDDRLKDTVKTYPSTHSSISTGCLATGINFSDDIVFFSDSGMEGISGDITTEQVLAHRSTLVDSKLLTENNYKYLNLVEHQGYLMVLVDDIVYLADSHQKVANNDHTEYEWFYWKLEHKFECGIEHNGILYLGSKEENVYNDLGYKKYTDGENIYWYDEENEILYDDNMEESQVSILTLTEVKISGIYTLTDFSDNRTIESYWTTKEDDFNYPQMLKTTNKRGFKSDVYGDTINIESKVDNKNFELLGAYNNTKGYIVAKLKKKKWNKIQLKFSANKPFGIYGVTLESYIGSYVKRS